jgi:hypothetical protein
MRSCVWAAPALGGPAPRHRTLPGFAPGSALTTLHLSRFRSLRRHKRRSSRAARSYARMQLSLCRAAPCVSSCERFAPEEAKPWPRSLSLSGREWNDTHHLRRCQGHRAISFEGRAGRFGPSLDNPASIAEGRIYVKGWGDHVRTVPPTVAALPATITSADRPPATDDFATYQSRPPSAGSTRQRSDYAPVRPARRRGVCTGFPRHCLSHEAPATERQS